MIVREPVVAGQFYPSGGDACRRDLEELLSSNSSDADDAREYVGGLVPHAGWMCSGGVAAKVFDTLVSSWTKHADRPSGRKPHPDVIILIGGVHRHRGKEAAMFGSGRWETPVGSVSVDARLAERIMGHTNLIVDDPYAHADEHSLEVQIPFVAHLFPNTPIVPIMVPIVTTAPEIGQAVGRTLKAYKYDALIVGTTDLTHYGPQYGFTPHGDGEDGQTWAKENDRRFVDLMCGMRAAELVPEAASHRNACNSGAAAATIAASQAIGATDGVLLEHTTSAEVLNRRGAADQDDSVGYAGLVFGRPDVNGG